MQRSGPVPNLCRCCSVRLGNYLWLMGRNGLKFLAGIFFFFLLPALHFYPALLMELRSEMVRGVTSASQTRSFFLGTVAVERSRYETRCFLNLFNHQSSSFQLCLKRKFRRLVFIFQPPLRDFFFFLRREKVAPIRMFLHIFFFEY